MLEECERKVLTLGIADRCILVRGDALDYNFVPDTYDSALVGFFLSHIPEDQEAALFESIGAMLRPSGQLLILDSAWTERRARYNQKVERQERRLNDGTRFEIYKRYLTETTSRAGGTSIVSRPTSSTSAKLFALSR